MKLKNTRKQRQKENNKIKNNERMEKGGKEENWKTNNT